VVHNRSSRSEPARRGAGLPALLTFECVARHLNFARAAEEMDVSPTAVSKTVRQLERQLGVRLFNRTTRSVALSEVGSQMLARLAPALAEIRSAMSSARSAAGRPSGTLRINTSYVAYATLVEPHLADFLSRYPEVRVDIAIDNALTDIVRSRFDAGIRFGHSVQSDMVAVPLGPPPRRIVVGAPAYFAARAKPRKPADLLAHDCIRQRLSGGARSFEWMFRIGGKTVAIDVTGRLMFDEMRSALNAAIRGCGLAYVFEPFAAASLATGALVRVLGDFSPAAESFYLYYPARTLMPGTLRAFVDFMRSRNRDADADSTARAATSGRGRTAPH
jgi:DNA-binding transcriptional LysR family regulator